MPLKKPVIWAVLLVIVLGFVVVTSMELLQITNPRRLEIAVILKTIHMRSDYWQMVRSGAKEAAKEYTVNIDITGPLTETDTAAQIRMVDEALLKKPDALILAATDYERLSSAVEKIKKSGTKLILIDSPVLAQTEVSLIATDNAEAGRTAGEFLTGGHADPYSHIISLSGSQGSRAEKERQRGFQERLAASPDIEYKGNFELEGTVDAAYEQVKNLLVKYPDLQGIAAFNETSTLAAARAIKENQRGKGIKIVGFDSSVYQIKLLEEGILQAIIVQKPFNIGYLAVEKAIQASTGIKVNPKVSISTQLITRKNMYTQENQELLFPMVEK